jgi:dCMP deaminase
MTRPTKDQYFMSIARIVATRSTCLRRAVGCVLVNERGHILATGYNGVAAGQGHCNEARGHTYGRANPGDIGMIQIPVYPYACPGAQSKSGEALDECGAIHAEQNALLQCADVHEIFACYTTTEPCVTCAKLLLNTSCRTVYFAEPYAGAKFGESLFLAGKRTWVHISN